MQYTPTRRVTLTKLVAVIAAVIMTLAAATSVTPVHAQRNRAGIVSEPFTVEPGHFRYFQFTVGDRAAVAGRFRAQGGSGNDVEVYILDEDSLENYRNGHRVQTYYNSGRVTVGTINVTLGAGRYYLVFNNSFSTVSNKAVNARVELQY
jgi:emp24/gp25L/p24 family/GOLD